MRDGLSRNTLDVMSPLM